MTDFRDLWFHSSDGLRLYARDYPGPDGTAPILLCLHGLTRNSADFGELAGELSARFRVLVPDQRGRGRSDYDSDPSRYHPGTYVQDMFTLLDLQDAENVVVIGTSMGGLMGMLMAALRPGLVQGLILNDVGPEVDPRGLARIKAWVGRPEPVATWEEAAARVRQLNQDALPDLDEAGWMAMTRRLYREENGRPVVAYDPAIAEPMAASDDSAVPPDLWPVFAACRELPLLVLRGETSDILSPEGVEAMRQHKPDLVVVEVPGRGHAPLLDEPAARGAIDAFLTAF